MAFKLPLHVAADLRDDAIVILLIGTGLLVTLTLVRAYAVARATSWAWNMGSAYLDAVRELPPADRLDARRHLELRRQMGGYSDFIVSSYSLWRQAYANEINQHPIKTLPYRVVRVLWGLALYVPLLTIAIVGLGIPTLSTQLGSIQSALGAALCGTLIILVATLSVQAFVYVTVFQGSGGLHTGVPMRFGSTDRHGAGNLLLFVTSVGLTWFGIIGVAVYINTRYGGFGLVPTRSTDAIGLLDQIGNFAYFSLATAAGVSDAQPNTGLAKIVTGATIALGLSYLLALFGSVIGIVATPQANQPTPHDDPPADDDAPAEHDDDTDTSEEDQLPLWE